MKRMLAALLAALAVMGTGTALAKTPVGVYASQGCLSEEQLQQIVQLLEREFGSGTFVLMNDEEGTGLRDLVLDDRAPQMAICTPQEAALYARDGLLCPLNGCIGDEARIAQAVLAACRQGDVQFMAPLYAQHRQMAVNRTLFEDVALEHLLSFRDYPVWLPMQMLQVLDEFSLAGRTPMELWPVTETDCEAVFALVQSLYCGTFLSQDGTRVTMGSDAAAAGVSWLADMAQTGLIGMAESREAALERFFAGETAVFPDWTDAEAARLDAMGEDAPEVVTIPYPASSGLMMRAFDLVGAAVFACGDQERDTLSEAAVAFLMEDEQAQQVLGERAIWVDGAQWMVPLGTNAQTAILRSALCDTLNAALAGTMSAEMTIQTAMAAAGIQRER